MKCDFAAALLATHDSNRDTAVQKWLVDKTAWSPKLP